MLLHEFVSKYTTSELGGKIQRIFTDLGEKNFEFVLWPSVRELEQAILDAVSVEDFNSGSVYVLKNGERAIMFSRN